MIRLRYAAIGLFIVVLVALASACGGGADKPAAASPAPDPVVARVNGHEIRHSVVEAARGQATLEQTPKTDAQAREMVIGEELVREEAARLGVTVTTAAVDERLAQITTSAGGADALSSALDTAGLTPQQFRQRIAVVLLEEGVGQKKSPGSATVAQAQAYYNANRSLFAVSAAVNLGDIPLRTKSLAESALQRLHGGETFEQTARQFANDPQSGRLGWVAISSLPSELAKAVSGLKTGQLSPPVQAVGGWHILKLYGRRAARVEPFSETRAAIVTELTRRQRAAALQAWLAKVRPTAGGRAAAPDPRRPASPAASTVGPRVQCRS